MYVTALEFASLCGSSELKRLRHVRQLPKWKPQLEKVVEATKVIIDHKCNSVTVKQRSKYC